MHARRISEVLDYWFYPQRHHHHGKPRPMWFSGGLPVDTEIRQLFGADIERAIEGRYDGWAATPRGTLALLLLLDQFTRNAFRGTGRAFAGDRRALAIARKAVARGFDRHFNEHARIFFYLPFEHSEALGDQHVCIGLIARFRPPRSQRWAVQHRDIISRFGRFPHRNAALERDSTEDEHAYLSRPHARFGQ